jgi:hypothetical protein
VILNYCRGYGGNCSVIRCIFCACVNLLFQMVMPVAQVKIHKITRRKFAVSRSRGDVGLVVLFVRRRLSYSDAAFGACEMMCIVSTFRPSGWWSSDLCSTPLIEFLVTGLPFYLVLQFLVPSSCWLCL